MTRESPQPPFQATGTLDDDEEPKGIISLINVADTPSRIVVSADGARLYVSSTRESVMVIDTASDSVIHSIEGHGNPLWMALHPTQARIYISYGNRPGNPVVEVISTITFDVIETITGFFFINGIALNSSGSRLYVPDKAGELDVITTATPQQRVKLRFTVGSDIIAIAPGNARAHLANERANWFVVHLGTNQLVASINTGLTATPSIIAHAIHEAHIYILYPNAGLIYIGDTTTNRQSEIISRLQHPWDIAFNSMRALAYVTETEGDRISIINTSSQSVSGTFEGFNRPRGIAATRDGRTAYVANSGDDTVARVRI